MIEDLEALFETEKNDIKIMINPELTQWFIKTNKRIDFYPMNESLEKARNDTVAALYSVQNLNPIEYRR